MNELSSVVLFLLLLRELAIASLATLSNLKPRRKLLVSSRRLEELDIKYEELRLAKAADEQTIKAYKTKIQELEWTLRLKEKGK